MIKKFFALLIAAVLCFAIVGCGGQASPNNAGNNGKTKKENVEAYIKETQPIIDKANSVTTAITKKMLEAAASGASKEQLEKLFVEISEKETLPTLTEELKSLEKITPPPDAKEVHDTRLKIRKMNIDALNLRMAGIKENNNQKFEQGVDLNKQSRELNEQLVAKVNEITGKTAEAKKDVLQLVEHKLQKNTIGYEVVGIVKNTTDKKINYAQITINAYDDKGNQVGNGLSNVTNLDPLGTWKFTTHLTGQGISSYKIVDISWRD